MNHPVSREIVIIWRVIIYWKENEYVLIRMKFRGGCVGSRNRSKGC